MMKKILLFVLFFTISTALVSAYASKLDNKTFQQKFRTAQRAGDQAKQANACLALIKTEPLTPDQKFTLWEYSLRMAENRSVKEEMKKEIILALTAYLKTPDSRTFSPLQRAKLLRGLVLLETAHLHDHAAAEAYFSELTDLVRSADSKDCRAVLVSLINSKINDVEFSSMALGKAKNLLPADRLAVYEIGIPGTYALEHGDQKTFCSLKSKAMALPFGPIRTESLKLLKRGTNPTVHRELLDALLKDPGLSPAERMRLLSEKRSLCGNVSWFQRGFNEVGAYERWRACTDEMLKCGELDAAALFRNAETAFGYGDFEFALNQTEKALAKNKGDLPDTALMVYLWKKDHARITALIAAELAKPKLGAERAKFLKAVAFLNTHPFKEFIGDFSTVTLGLQSDKDKLLLARQVSDLFFRARRYEVCRDIYNVTYRDLYVKLEPLVYKVRFADDIPRTADGFARTKYFDDWSGMETRFWVYGDDPNISNDIDVKRFLKESVQPQIKPEWRTGICGLCDAEGLHLFIRCEDPDVQEIITKKRNGGGLECYFRPDPDSVYSMWFLQDLPSAMDDVNVDWASPSPRYKRTDDVIFRDACMTKSGVAAHFFIPWHAFHRYLPFNGKMWYFGMQRWCKGGDQTISGQGHELARMLQLKFEFAPEQKKAILRTVCKTAFNTFKANQQISVWSEDAALGDPAFYKQELEALVKELNEAGDLLDKPDADLDAIYQKYVPQWAEFDYIIAEKRRNYLRSSFFR